MAAFKVVSPLVHYLESRGDIKPFAGMEGERSKLVTLNFPANPQNGDPFYFNSDTSLDGSNACITAIEFLVEVASIAALSICSLLSSHLCILSFLGRSLSVSHLSLRAQAEDFL